MRVVVSVRTPNDLYYASEIRGPETTIVYTREAPEPSARPPGRITRDDLAGGIRPDITAYVCGSSGFADASSRLLVDLGVPASQVRVERFGPTS